MAGGVKPRIRRRSGLRVKLLLTALVFAPAPLLGYWYTTLYNDALQAMENESVRTTAALVAAALASHPALLAPDPAGPTEEGKGRYVPSLPFHPVIDGAFEEWGEPILHPLTLEAGRHRALVVLGKREGVVYASILYEQRSDQSRISNSGPTGKSQIRITVWGADERVVRFAIPLAGDKPGAPFVATERWAPDRMPSGRKRAPLMESAAREGALEFLIREEESPWRRIEVAVAAPRADTGTGPADRFMVEGASFDLGEKPEKAPSTDEGIDLATLIDTLSPPGIGVVVWARDRTRLAASLTGKKALLKALADEDIMAALAGAILIRRLPSGEWAQEAIMAITPIRDPHGAILGAAGITLSGREKEATTFSLLARSLGVTVAVFLFAAATLFLFASRLTYRIRKLDSALERLFADERVSEESGSPPLPGVDADDEIGDIARAVASLVVRLDRRRRFLDQLPGVIRHEINNPLNAISVSLQNLKEGPPDNQAKYLDAARRGQERLRAIVDRLSEAASMERALEDEKLTPLELSTFIGRYVENARSVMEEEGDILFENQAGGEALIWGTPSLIEQLLDKLIDNARRFRHPGSPVMVTLALADGDAVITVQNDGPPLPEGLNERIFDTFVTASRAGERQREDEGPRLGIGLAVVRIIAEKSGGRVQAQNHPHGALIAVHLPLFDR